MKFKVLCIFTCFAILLLSCSKKQEAKVDEDKLRAQDSLALHAAIFPCQSCLPLYYAEATGMLKSTNEDIRLLHLSTMEDCDTALIYHRAEVSVSDLARLLCMKKSGFEAIALNEMQSPLQLVTAKGKRITATKQLKERLVAMDRHSYTDYLTDKMIEGTGIDRLDLFRTQFNNMPLRCEMLNNILVDGALLDEPYATFAVLMGGKNIWQSPDEQGWMVLATTPKVQKDKRIMKQVNALQKVYDQAVDAMVQADTKILDSILTNVYKLPVQAVDTLPQLKAIKFNKLQPIKPETQETASNWLKQRGWI